MSLVSSLRAALERLRVGQQLHAAFALMLFLVAVVGGVALHSLAGVQAQASSLADKWLMGVGHLSSARAAVVESREFEIKFSRTDDHGYQSEYQDKMTEANKAVAAAMASYESLVVGDDERSLFAAFTKSWAAYQLAQQKVVALGRDKKRQDASDISDGLGATTAEEALAAVAALSSYNFANGKVAAEQSAAVYARAQWLVSGLLALALLAGLAMAWSITRKLISQLGGEPRDAAAVAQAAAAGELTLHIALRPGDSHSLMAQLKSMQDNLARVVANVRQNAESVSTASAEIAQGNQDLSVRTEQQAGALEVTASSMEQLGATVKQNADNARQANQLALGASTVAVRGGRVVGEVVTTMKGINDASKKIADIISVIDSIAFQTNILALNAAVEAARAGEQGRGFAVVAAEVRSLAQRSAEAAKEIKTLISTSVERVAQGTTLVDEAGETMTEIVNSIKRVTDIMGEISSASSEQSAGVAQVGQAIAKMDEATQQNAALVEESAAAAENLKLQARQLVQAVAVFRLAPGGAAKVAPAAVPMAAPKAPAPVERRSPNRANNVTRPDFKPKASPLAPPPLPTGTDDGWTTF